LFLAATFNPGVDILERRLKLPRSIGIIILYIIVAAILTLIIGGMIPILFEQIVEISQSLNNYLQSAPEGSMAAQIASQYNDAIQEIQIFIEDFNLDSISSDQLSEWFGTFKNSAKQIFTKIFSGVFNFILIILLAFFMVVERDSLKRFFTSLFPSRYEEYISHKIHVTQRKVAEWVHGQVALFIIIGLIAFIGLKILGVKYALTLALIAGLAEFLPYIGPVLAFATAAPVAFNQSPLLGVWVVIFYMGIQFVEGNIIVPLVMKKAVGLSPIVTIMAMLIGWQVATLLQFSGVIGMILSVPVASILSIFVNYFTGRKK
ncbi:MAG: AI-2E family transporter, partial [bacterium]